MDLLHERAVPTIGTPRPGSDVPPTPMAANFLLAALPPDEAQRLWPHLERVRLVKGEVVYANGRTPSHACFPTTAVVALQCGLSDGRTGDFAIIGHEGVVGSPLLTGSNLSLVRAEVRCTGNAYRLRTALLSDAVSQAPLSALVLRHTQTLIAQAAQTALCMRRHSIREQLSALLLATLDRLPRQEVAMTHEAIASALGVRREGITEAAHRLQQDGRIRYARGHIEVLNRTWLEHDACECYAVAQRLHDSLLPHATRPDRCGLGAGVHPRPHNRDMGNAQCRGLYATLVNAPQGRCQGERPVRTAAPRDACEPSADHCGGRPVAGRA